MINVNKDSFSIFCKAIARLFIASMIACHLNNRICARVYYESRSLLVSLDNSMSKDDGPKMGRVSVISSLNNNRARSCLVHEYKDSRARSM